MNSMTGKRGTRLAAVLYFVAAALAWASVVVHWIADRELKWTLLAAGLFCAAMGFSALARARRPGS